MARGANMSARRRACPNLFREVACEHSRNLGHAGHASAAGAAEPAARTRHYDRVRADDGDARERDRRLGPARLRRGHRPWPFLRALQLHSQHAGFDPPCAGRQLRKLRADAGRDPGAAPGAWRRPADRRGPRLEASAKNAGAGLYAARGRNARSAHDSCDRRDDCEARGGQRRAGRSARGDAADDAGDCRAHDVFVRNGSLWRGVARFRDGIWRAAGAAAFSRSVVAPWLAQPAGFLPRPFSQAMDAFCRHADGGTPCGRQERRRPARATCSI
jgi:hypothetical protein